ncbi:cell division protein SepF [Haloechinothrix halophila]|uniref:cell division protein SepF n=1 Tax=Haloechinothrix halophila TaxID=1069073 RepID=UPI000421C8F2|nr:cell division protein SepF [Haloechinothrix halophila]
MSALEKLKAYFGMVPADDGIDDIDDRYDYPHGDRYGRGYEEYDYPERPVSRAALRRASYRIGDDIDDDYSVRGRGRSRPEPAVSGALAMDRQPEPVRQLRPVAEQQPPVARDPLSRIVTLHPTGYSEARDIGEAFRDGNPVIMNLTEMDNADAKRLVDFAAGLAFALRGAMDKVTSKVFLLSPPDIDVTAEDRRRIAEGGMFLRR